MLFFYAEEFSKLLIGFYLQQNSLEKEAGNHL